MSFDAHGYVLSAEAGDALWFLDTRMTVKAGGAQTGGAFTLLEWAAPTGFGPPRHVHHLEDEGFYVLEGQMQIVCGDRRWTAGPGAFAFLPHGIPHAFVISEGPVRGLQITSPSGFEHFINDQGRTASNAGLPEPTQPDVGQLIAAGQRHGHDNVGPPLTIDRSIAESAT